MTTAGRYVLGAGCLLIVAGSLGLAAVAVRRRWLPEWQGALARLAEATIVLALLVAVLEVLGAAGAFRLGPITGLCAAAGLAGAAGMPARDPSRSAGFPRRRAGLLIAALIGGAVTAEWATATLQSYDVGIRTFDSLWYHLPWAASFAQTGQITGLRFTDVEYLTAFYPATAEMLHGLGIVFLGRDALSPALNLAWLGLTLLAGWCVGRPRGLGPATLLGAALAMATPMFTSSQAGSAANDVVGVAFLLAAAALYVNADGSPAALVLAGVAAGLAVSVKLSLLAPVAALTLGVLVLERRRSGLWLGPLVAAGCFWYLRNWIVAGNPLPWVSIPGLPTPAPPLQQHTGYSVLHYLGAGGAWAHFFRPGLHAGLGPWWPAILASAVIGPVLCLAPPARATVRVLGLAALAAAVAYLATPESAAGPAGRPLGFAFNLRYAAPALALCLTVLPLAPPLGGRRARVLTLLALLATLTATLAQPRLWPARHLAASLGVGAAVVLVAYAAGILGRGRSRGAPLRHGYAVSLALTLSAALAVGGFFVERHYLRGRYAFQPGVSYLAHAWAYFRGVHHARVAVAGTYGGFFTYPLYGLDDSNSVSYIGHRGPHGSFTPVGGCRAWRAAVNSGRFRYLLITPERDPWQPKSRALSASPDAAWIAGDPHARAIYRRRALGWPIVLYRLTGRLDPAGCTLG